MKIKSYNLSRIVMILFLMINKSFTFCSSGFNDIRKAQIIELDKGCKLVLDSAIVLSDSLPAEIINSIREVIPKIQSLIPADSITVDLKISKAVLPVWGVVGRSTSDHSLEFSYDPEHQNFKIEHLMCGLVHEFMHVSRLRMPQWELTLLECMISEGLADHLSNEVLGCDQPPWAMTLSPDEIEQYLIRSKPVLFNKHDTWNAEFEEKYFNPWMFGRLQEDMIPVWTGYSLGWVIVENYLQDHPGIKVSEIVWLSAEKIAESTIELRE